MSPPTERFSVSDRAVLVTGGTRGIGLMMARGFVESGATTFICSRKADSCERAAAELGRIGTCIAIPADVSEENGRAALVEILRSHADGLDVLINNAGTNWGARLDEYPPAAFDKVFAINVKAVFALTQQLLPDLRAAATPEAPARIINIGSVDGLRVSIWENYAYSASKAALHMLTRQLAVRLAPVNITVNAIAPGPFPSNMMSPMLEEEGPRNDVMRRIPLARLGEPRDISGTAIFLAGPSSTWMTGAVIPLDGGMGLTS